MLKIAAVQMDVTLGNKLVNLSALRERLSQAAEKGARLIVFPECALTGYAFENRSLAARSAESIPGIALETIRGDCNALGVWTILGLLERAGDKLYNAAVLVGPQGVALKYRKLHLPCLGVDRFVDPGDLPLEVAATPIGKIGLSICYDGSFPETTRVLKLRGAQLVVLPTNWPDQADVSIRHQSIVRAFENHVNYVAVNRVGNEGAFHFPGGSKIVSFTGQVVAEAQGTPQILLADLNLPAADMNRVIHSAGKYELDRIGHRRPDMYGAIVEPKPAAPPTS